MLWRFSQDESTAALTTEFLAIGNHRPAIRDEIAKATEEARQLQLDALRSSAIARGAHRPSNCPPKPSSSCFTGITRLIRLEEGVGVTATHREVVRAFETYLEVAENQDAKAAPRGRNDDEERECSQRHSPRRAGSSSTIGWLKPPPPRPPWIGKRRW